MSTSQPSLPDSVTLTQGEGGLDVVRVATSVATAEVYLHGAQVTAWTPAGAQPVIWVSNHSVFEGGKAIRGGIPICFPWFGPGREAGLAPPAHGFARIATWRLTEARDDDGVVTLTLRLTADDVADLEASRAWPHTFAATNTVRIGMQLDVGLTVHNTGAEPFSFETALHTYLAVRDIRTTTVDGLDAVRYLDKAPGAEPEPVTQRGPVTFTAETDRVYASAGTVVVQDESAGRTIGVSKQGSANTVVWNPWAEKAAAMADFGDDEWRTMLCVEAANVLDEAVALAPGAAHTLSVTYTASGG